MKTFAHNILFIAVFLFVSCRDARTPLSDTEIETLYLSQHVQKGAGLILKKEAIFEISVPEIYYYPRLYLYANDVLARGIRSEGSQIVSAYYRRNEGSIDLQHVVQVDEKLGVVEGHWIYPGEVKPPDFEVCARNFRTKRTSCTSDSGTISSFKSNQTYHVRLEPGNYEVFSRSSEKGFVSVVTYKTLCDNINGARKNACHNKYPPDSTTGIVSKEHMEICGRAEHSIYLQCPKTFTPVVLRVESGHVYYSMDALEYNAGDPSVANGYLQDSAQ